MRRAGAKNGQKKHGPGASPFRKPRTSDTSCVGRGRAEGSSKSKATAANGDRGQGDLVFLNEGRRENFGLQDLLRASAEVLGSGEFGSSYKALLLNGPAVVVKRFKEMNRLGKEEFQQHMRRIGRLSHPNLLPLVAYYYRKEEKLLVTDFIPYGSLASLQFMCQGFLPCLAQTSSTASQFRNLLSHISSSNVNLFVDRNLLREPNTSWLPPWSS
ncbi:uncharacterized protein A4U43_C05F11040 [Asparagus officinalis]|uniref:Protein kinase domain-containing protein n=1 Tax=Asparagus officinalis TaxID=4686 RepID=A0A5P1ERV8_ASPOF|nr:uncharacterized protein A4U43_C05F11040 [Asparagus officinalis]